MTPSRLRWWWVILGAWTVPALIEATQYYFSLPLTEGRQITWLYGLVRALPRWYAWALLTPLVIGLARRYRVEHFAWPQLIAIHGAAAFVITSVQMVLHSLSLHWFMYAARGWTLDYTIWRVFLNSFGVSFIVYWGILGVYYSFDFYRVMREKDLAAERLRRSLSEANLEALKRQLQPHFLFNTLHTVAGLAVARNTAGVLMALRRLGDLLDALLRTTGQVVPLEEELELLGNYVEIQRLRLGEHLELVIDVSDDLDRMETPTFLIQPLVENSITHGIGRSPSGGRVDVTVRGEDGMMKLTVSDTGSGEPLPDTAFVPGVGLRTTQERLAHLYGERSACRFVRDPNGGVRVEVEWPMKEFTAESGAPVDTPEQTGRGASPAAVAAASTGGAGGA